MNAEVNVPESEEIERLVNDNRGKFTREAILAKETKGTFKFDEDVQNDMSVFRSIYVEKWTQIRGHNRIRVTIEAI